MKFKDQIKIIISTLIFAILIFYVGINSEGITNPKDAYFVYLDGMKIGVIEEKQELLNKINKEQEAIKKKYKVEQVYPAKGLEIVKSTTFDKKFSKIDDIYNKINNFSIKGYVVTINSKKEDVKKELVYILNKDDFDEAMKKLITAFIPEEKYLDYINENQKEIIDVGEHINNIFIDEKITIREDFISTKNDILTNVEDISRYLLYGTSTENKKYTVKSGDTLETIAEKNNLNITELLIANPNIKSKDALLSSKGDQTLNVSLVSPIVSVVSKTELVEKQIAYFETIVRYDNKLNYGTSYVEQKGENGIARVKYEVEYVNGEILDAKKISMTELSPSINKIIVRGGYRSTTPVVGNPEDWARPTVNYCVISSGFGPRWGDFHDAIDIRGCGGLGSPIFAANDGVVFFAGKSHLYNPGIHIRIDHQNGYYTSYLHLSKVNVSVGQVVKRGQKIGEMGSTGRSSGVHLHFSVYYIPGSDRFIYEPRQYAIDPLKVSSAFRY